MNQTRAQRIHRGFHRFGIVLAGIVVILGAVAFTVVAIEEPDKSYQQAFVLAGFSVTAVVAYVLSRAVGWIISGFASE